MFFSKLNSLVEVFIYLFIFIFNPNYDNNVRIIHTEMAHLYLLMYLKHNDLVEEYIER